MKGKPVAVLVTDITKFSDGDVMYWVEPNPAIPELNDGITGLVVRRGRDVESGSIIVLRKTDNPIDDSSEYDLDPDYVYWEFVE